MHEKFILNFTPTGMIPTKAVTPNLPVQAAEIIEQVCDAAEQGANLIHLHARDPKDGIPTYQKELYGQIIGGIRARYKDLVLCVSTSGRDFPGFAERSQCLELSADLKPDMGSLTLASLNFGNQASINTPEMIKSLAQKMLSNGIKPELEAFDLGMINYAKYLIRKGLIQPPYYFNLILGNIASAQADLLSLGLMINELPPDSVWSAGGIGDFQLTANALGIVAGGGVRVGLEDNIYFDPERTKLATNRELVARIVAIAAALGRRPYSHQEARKVLGIA